MQGAQEENYFACFFKELCHKTNQLFQLTSKGVIPLHNVLAVEQKDFFIIGRIAAASILLSGCSPHCFLPFVADILVHREMDVLDDNAYCLMEKCTRLKVEKV